MSLTVEPSVPTLGIVADDPLQRHLLQMVMQRYGFKVLSNREPERLDLNTQTQPCDLWLVDIHGATDHSIVDQLLESDQRVLFGIDPAPKRGCLEYPKWEKRLYSKVTKMVGKDILKQTQQQSLSSMEFRATEQKIVRPSDVPIATHSMQPQHIWVLGASLGGPAAVKEFLDSLPEQLPVAFIYAQHIDQNFQGVLAKVLGRHSWYNLTEAKQGHMLRAGEVLLVPADREFSLKAGKVELFNQPWKGPYGPSIDQVMMNVARDTQQVNHIIFSGMGNDGSEACAELNASQPAIWAQSPDTCGSSSMPDSARDTGAVSFSGSPHQLAQHLVHQLRMHYQQPATMAQEVSG